MVEESLHKALMTADLGSDPEILSLMNELKKNDLPDDIAYYYYYHNLLNLTSLNGTHVLETKGNLPSRLLSTKTTPPSRPACLAGPIESLGDLKERQDMPRKMVAN